MTIIHSNNHLTSPQIDFAYYYGLQAKSGLLHSLSLKNGFYIF